MMHHPDANRAAGMRKCASNSVVIPGRRTAASQEARPGMTTLFLLPPGKMLQQELRQHLDARRPRAAGRRHPVQRAFRLLPALEDHLDRAGGDRISHDELRQVGNAVPPLLARRIAEALATALADLTTRERGEVSKRPLGAVA